MLELDLQVEAEKQRGRPYVSRWPCGSLRLQHGTMYRPSAVHGVKLVKWSIPRATHNWQSSDHLHITGQFFFNTPTAADELSVCCQLRVMIRMSVTLLQMLMIDILVKFLRTLQ